ncbi:MAG: MarR family transcriptional regulator [Anaerolineae bacterium]|nr:MarR family transcriptional regulator [Anaerolineae bacterium]
MPQSQQVALGRLVPALCKAFHERIRLRLEPLGLYKGQPYVIELLSEQDGLSQGELGEAMRLQPATVTKMVQRMEQAGFVERRADVRDQRISRVYLTPAGQQVRPALDAIWDEIAAELFAGFSEEDQRQLEELLQRLCENLVCGLPEG